MNQRPALVVLPPNSEDDRLHDAWLYAAQKYQRAVYAMEAYLDAPTRERENAKLALDHAELMCCGAMQQLFDAYRDVKADEDRKTAA